jgi:hypothetical protein
LPIPQVLPSEKKKLYEKAKKMADDAPVSVIKERLEKAGIVKKGSKAPEKMLRTMYTDLLITKKGL